jgi:site-specific recombinase XerD
MKIEPRTQIQPQMKRRNPRGVFEKVSCSGEWWIRYVDAQGRFRREKAGTKSAAIDLYRKRKHQAVEGRKLPEKLRQATVSFTELCDDTSAYIRANYSRPQHDLGRLETIREWFGSRAAESITSKEVKAALAGIRANSASSYNHHHTLISLVYRLAIENDKANINPARGIRRKKENNSRVRFLTPEEEQKLREAIRSNPAWCGHEPELTLALNTGLRSSSMYRDLLWKNVDLPARIATVPQTKNGHPVHIPLNADAMKALMIFRSRGDGTGVVVRNQGGEPLRYNAFWFVPAVRGAGIRDYKWHDNRHTYASRLRQKGVPLGNIAELLGHKGLAMTRRYAHLSISNLHEAVARIQTDNSQNQLTPQPTPDTASQATKVEYVQ